MKRRRLFSVVAIVGVFAAAFAWHIKANNLYIKGALASGSVMEVKGVAYAPIRDIAKAMNLSLSKTGRGWELSDAGGANMVQGTTGKVGDELFNGRHRFKVVKVFRGPKYINQFSGDNYEVRAIPEGNDIVAITCRLKNGTKETVTYDLFMGPKTGLTDTEEHSYGCFIGTSVDALNRGATVLPGAAVDFAVTFQVPRNAELKDLVYQVADFSMKEQVFRVSLK
jgi:hypothetical protein